ncbi:hypothetical protein NUACC21_53910 [Scytonema sp. NUACC21]
MSVSFIEPKLEIETGSHALVIGGSIAGLLTARVLVNYFDKVTIVERDRFPDQPEARRGIPQANHIHVLLVRGLRILERLFPGIEGELIAAGASPIDWIGDWSMLGNWGWAPRFPSNLNSLTCSRYLIDWALRRRLTAYDNLEFLENCQVTELLTNDNKSKVTGVKLRFGGEGNRTIQPQLEEIASDLVVDASGRRSSLPKWLESLGYEPPEETVINSFLGYASCWYQRKEAFEADWQGLAVVAKPPHNRRAGYIYPIEGNRWLVTLQGVGRDYPPNDEAGFLDFARSLRSPILYDTIKDAKPISPIYSYRGTENRLRHYEKLFRLPEGVVTLGDAVCAFNPIYGQGMTVAANGALTLNECLQQQFKANKDTLTGLGQRFQKRLAQVNTTPWLMATGADLRWPTTEGRQPNEIDRLKHQYLDRVLRLGVKHPQVYRTFGEVAHMLKPPTALFRPDILAQVLLQAIGESFSDRSLQERSAQ